MSLMSTQSREALASPKTFTILLLIIGLCGLAYSIMLQRFGTKGGAGQEKT